MLRRHAPVPRLLRPLACALALAFPMSACATQSEACRSDPITGSERCAPASSDYGEAVGTVVAAGAVWSVAGCTVNGCEPPFRCNAETKLCERISCAEGESACPPGYVCDPDDQLCK